MSSDITRLNLSEEEVAQSCKDRLQTYAHPPNESQSIQFKTVYRQAGLNDSKLGDLVGISRSTMSRYRRGIWIPGKDMKIRIAVELSKATGSYIDTLTLWNGGAEDGT